MESWNDENANEDEAELQDYRSAAKDATVFLIDASEDMHKELPGAGDGDGEDDGPKVPFQMALKCAHAALKSKVFNAPNDLIGVLFFGTKDNVECRDFKHISTFLTMDTAEADHILKCEEYLEDDKKFAKDFGGSSSDFSLSEALWQSQTLFADIKGKVGQKKIILLSCNDDPHGNDAKKKRQAMSKATDLHNTGVYLDVFPIGRGFRLDRFYKDLIQLADDENPLDKADPAERFDDLLRIVRKRIHKKRSIGRTFLSLGPGLKLGVSTYNLVQKAYKPSKIRLARDTNEEVKMNRAFINHDTGAALLPSEINKFQEYGGKRIAFSMDETKGITSMQTDPGLKLLGFKPKSLMKWGHFVRSSYFIYPDEESIKGSRMLFSSLLIKCLEKEVMALCAYKARDSSGPSVVALYPQAEELDDENQQVSPPGFHLIFLPYADDLRSVPDVKLVEPEPEQVDAAKKVIKKLKMKCFRPEAFENPELQSHYSMIEGLALQRDDIQMGEDTTLPPVERMKKKLDTVGKEFLEAVYPPDYNPDVAINKRKAPAKREAAGGSKKREPAAKKAKPTDSDDFDMGGYVEAKTVNKLTVKDLKAYLDSVSVSTSGMKKAQLVEAVYDYFDKK